MFSLGVAVRISFRIVRGLITFLPFLNFRIRTRQLWPWRDRRFVADCFACARDLLTC